MASSKGDSSKASSSRALRIPRREDLKTHPSTSRSRGGSRYDSHIGTTDSNDLSASSFSSDTSSLTRNLPHRRIHRDRQTEASTLLNLEQSPGTDLSNPSPTSSGFSEDDFHAQSRSSKLKAKSVKELDPPNTMPCLVPARSSPLGPSMLSNQTYKSVNLNSLDPDEPPRLITYTKVGQGFTWNEEIFLPSYMVNRYSKPRRKQYDGDLGEDDIEVAEIFVTDEEATNMMP